MLLRKAKTAMVGVVMAVSSWLPLQAETLGDALAASYRNSNLLEQNRALLRAADENVAQALASLRPVLNFIARANYSNSETIRGANFGSAGQGTRYSPESLTSSMSLTASVTVYDGGAGRLALEAAKETVMATRQGLIGVEHNVLMSAVQAYLGLRLSEDLVALRQGNVRVLTRELSAARDRFELGEITRTDVALAEARLASARALLAQAEGNVMVGRESYQLAVGQKPGQLRQPPRVQLTVRNVDEAKRIARSQHYLIRQMQHELAAAELNVQRAAKSAGPNVSASASLGMDDRGLVDRGVSLQLNQPIYQGGAISSVYRQAMARRDAARSQLHHTVAQVEQAVGEAWAQRQVARASIEATDRQIAAAQAAFDGVREEAQLGARTTLDVLNAEQELLDARAQRLEAVTNEYLANYGILSAMGNLTVNYLQLGVPTYDVTAYYNAVKNAPATSVQGRRLDRVMESIGRR